MTQPAMDSWSGRDDGPGIEHARWHNTVRPVQDDAPGFVLYGFASDEGVTRNQGRPGAADGPQAIRQALGSMAVHHNIALYDAGDETVEDHDLESAQQRYGQRLAQLLQQGHLTVGLGGGHDITWASYQGVRAAWPNARLGILNLDAHFDNRTAAHSTSGTSFAQIMDAETQGNCAVLTMGLSEPDNTQALFEKARTSGMGWMTDERWVTYPAEAGRAVAELLDNVDVVYLTVDLDVLPAAVAPGVSAPASYGVPLPLVSAVVDHVASAGKLVHADIAELNPQLDVDGRTAVVAARLVHRLTTQARGQALGQGSGPQTDPL